MDDVRDALPDTEAVTQAERAPTDNADRRRPGRLSAVPAALVPLLRRQNLLSDGESGSADDGTDDSDGTRMFVGIVVGALMATPFWLLLGIIIWWALR